MGFRFTCLDTARKLGITGWVRNLSDGRVEVLSEAEESSLKEFLSSIDSAFSRYIKDVEIDWQEAGERFSEFTIE